MPIPDSTKPSVLLDVLFATVQGGLVAGSLAGGFKLGPVEAGAPAVRTGLSIQCWGILFILSYFFPDASYLLRGLMWCCENTSTPRGEWTAILWGLVAFTICTALVLAGFGMVRL